MTSRGERQAVRIDPDLEFIQSLGEQGGEGFKKCFQCGTCSGTCTLSPDQMAFPCKEMAWASWGMKDRLLEDLDVWLCHQCNDCSVRCPRGARPGDVLGAIRQLSIQHHSVPRFLGRWANQPQGLLLLLGLPTLLLTLAMYYRAPLERALGFAPQVGERIVYAYSTFFPHWLINLFFGITTALVLLLVLLGVRRFWHTLSASTAAMGITTPVKPLLASIGAVLKSILGHEKFAKCEREHTRLWSHSLVFFGFAALTAVTLWVITAPHNPLIQRSFVYPFAFLDPWKVLANLGGAAVVAGLFLMILKRIQESAQNAVNSYADWVLLGTISLVVLTGFFTEVLHYVRLEPHRHVAYFVHLVFIFALLAYLPFSKFAHIVYRTTALVFAERYGRRIGETPAAPAEPVTIKQEEEHVPASA
jgi:quinone-modifying oxidoreductase subunit QmoC